MLTQVQLKKMFLLQDSMNSKINPLWLQANNDWTLAAMQECCEAIDHHGWKWWKNQTPDLPQLQMELVDIWHFGLSKILTNYKGDVNKAVRIIDANCAEQVFFDSKAFQYENQSLLQNLKLMAGLFASDRFEVNLFNHIIEQAGMTVDELYKQYVGKNVLNFFRQDNGYKDGSYIKIWNGKEDNEVLVELMSSLDMNDSSIDLTLYNKLKVEYSLI
jgi:dimeric dUTPase (all-alpha-NTP-PPase superfamily)